MVGVSHRRRALSLLRCAGVVCCALLPPPVSCRVSSLVHPHRASISTTRAVRPTLLRVPCPSVSRHVAFRPILVVVDADRLIVRWISVLRSLFCVCLSVCVRVCFPPRRLRRRAAQSLPRPTAATAAAPAAAAAAPLSHDVFIRPRL